MKKGPADYRAFEQLLSEDFSKCLLQLSFGFFNRPNGIALAPGYITIRSHKNRACLMHFTYSLPITVQICGTFGAGDNDVEEWQVQTLSNIHPCLPRKTGDQRHFPLPTTSSVETR